MADILRIARWELFKLQRGRMAWVLLAILLGFTQLGVWGSFASYTSAASDGGRIMLPGRLAAGGPPRPVSCNELQSNPSAVVPAGLPPQATTALLEQCRQQQARLAERYRQLKPAGGVATVRGIAASVGLVLLGVLGTAFMGSEYGLGTLRPILARGAGRLAFLGGKLLALIAAATGALVIAGVAGAISGLLAGTLAVPPPDAAPAAGAWGTVMIAFARTWGALIAFMTLAGSLTVLARSTAVGMAVSLGYFVFEGILARLLSSVFSWFEPVIEYLPMRNINALAGSATGALPANLVGGSGPEPLQALLVAGGYVVLFAGAAALCFRRRDIGAAG